MIPNNQNVICERIIATGQFQSTNRKQRATEMMMMFQYCIENDCVEENKGLLTKLFRQKIGNKVNLPDYDFDEDFKKQLNNARKIRNSQKTINEPIQFTYEEETVINSLWYDYKMKKLIYVLMMYAKVNRMLGRHYDLDHMIEDVDEIKKLAGLKRDDCDGFLTTLIKEGFIIHSTTKKFNKYATCEEELFEEYDHLQWNNEYVNKRYSEWFANPYSLLPNPDKMKLAPVVIAEYETFYDIADGIKFINDSNWKTCTCCDSKFTATTKSKTDLCPYCYQEDRKLKDRLRKAANKI